MSITYVLPSTQQDTLHQCVLCYNKYMTSVEKKVRLGGWSHNKFRELRKNIMHRLDKEDEKGEN